MTASTNSYLQSQAQSQKSCTQSNDEMNPATTRRKPDLSRRRQIHHAADLFERGQYFGVPNELIDAIRFKLLKHKDFVVLCAILSAGPNFHLKRSFLEGLVDKDSITKVMQKLVDWGIITVERVPDERGGFINLHHTLPLEHWDILRQVADLRKTGVRKTGVRKTGGLNKIEGEQEENKNKNNNDDETRVEPPKASEETVKPKAASSSVSREAVRYAKSLEWLYSKSRNGSYDWEKVNRAAEDFLQKVTPEWSQAVADWLENHAKEWTGRVRIQKDMFFRLSHDFELSKTTMEFQPATC
jgi:predicted transcriptional regulator